MFPRDVIHPFSKGVIYRFTYVHLDGTEPYNFTYSQRSQLYGCTKFVHLCFTHILVQAFWLHGSAFSGTLSSHAAQNSTIKKSNRQEPEENMHQCEFSWKMICANIMKL